MAQLVKSGTLLSVRQEGDHVLLVLDGKGYEMPWHAAIELGKLLLERGHRAEEIALVEAIIEDQAILTRTGAPFGLVKNPDVAREAAKAAVNDTKLRRYLPGGVKAKRMMFGPVVRNVRRNPHVSDRND